jgi:REP element-mobilizing transposase RayT
VHVTCRIARDLGTLRTRDMYLAIRRATRLAARRGHFRIVHLSIQRDHLHLIVEADHKSALSCGMRGFAISAAKQIHRALRERAGVRRCGTVFTDRYHLHVLGNPTEVRRAIAYVANNWRRHGEDRSPSLAGWTVDLFSSGVSFDGWAEPQTYQPPPSYEPLVVVRPRSWVLSGGWRRGGGPISMFAVPGPLTK